MAIQFTQQQTRVLQARKHNILVSAAAGSGKTAVLVERIVRMISEGPDPMDIDRLLVVTFTKAAAAQMRERIGAAIAARIEEEPDNVHLQRQETLLHNAQITTMDSFFTFLLRNNFSDIDMDPGFRQMDQTEADLMRKDAMEEFLEECYAQGDSALKICTDQFCRGAGDKEIENILDILYKQAVSHPDPKEWLRDRAGDYSVRDEEELFGTAWMQFIILSAAEKIRDLQRQYERLIDFCSLPDGPDLYLPLVRNELLQLKELGDTAPAGDAGLLDPGEMRQLWERIRGILSMSFENMPRFYPKKNPGVDPAKKETACALRKSAKESVEKLQKKYGASVVGLTLDEGGIPKTAEGRFEIAKRIVSRAEALGIDRRDVYIDCLTLTVSAEQDACRETLKALHRVKTELGCKTCLGVSNISFGLPNRELVNSTFLTMALEEGLDLPIINPNLDAMTGAVRAYRVLAGIDKNSLEFIESYNDAAPAPKQKAEGTLSLDAAVYSGLKKEAALVTEELLQSTDPMAVVNEMLIPALDRVGEDFEKNKIFLPQLIQSANTAQECHQATTEQIRRREREQGQDHPCNRQGRHPRYRQKHRQGAARQLRLHRD